MDVTPHKIQHRDWLQRPDTRRLMAALDPEGRGDVARFVGGVVRDAWLGCPVKDIDLATVLDPQEVSQRLEAAGIKVVPTGIDHGTVTAVVDHRPFEITTLREDEETFGRHARVAFTDDWAADAARRDFTMNALYADLEGRVFDPVGGLADLNARRVRFIGDADARIEEDALRILRFFRFTAWYGQTQPDADGLAACTRRAADMTRLSVERVRDELLKLLAAPDPVPVIREMAAHGVLEVVLAEAEKMDRLAGLVRIETMLGKADALRRLGALLPEGAAGVGARLRLSKQDQIRLSEMIEARVEIVPDGSDDGLNRKARALLYRLGRAAFMDHALLNWAGEGGNPDDTRWQGFLAAAQGWPIPAFPLKGRDLLGAGLTAGPDVGDMLEALEAWWIARDFAPDRDALLARVKSES